METSSHRMDIDGYLAGELSPERARAVEEHLADCAGCREEVETLREIQDALGGIPPEALLDGPPDDADLVLQRTLRQVRAEASRGRTRRGIVAATAAAVVAATVLGAGVLLGRSAGGDRPEVAGPAPTQRSSSVASAPSGVRFASATDAATGARLTVRVVPAAGWVRLNAAVTGIPQGQPCRLIVVGRDGAREIAGSWVVSETGEADGTTLDGAVLIPAAEVASVVVENTSGRRFVEARL